MKYTIVRLVQSRGGAGLLIAVLGMLAGAAAGAAAHAASASALRVVTVPSPPGSKNNNTKRTVIVSPYARAAAAHARAGQAAGHAPTMMQGMGRPHRAGGAGGRN